LTHRQQIKLDKGQSSGDDHPQGLNISSNSDNSPNNGPKETSANQKKSCKWISNFRNLVLFNYHHKQS